MPEIAEILKKDGYDVSVVQNPTISLEDDVAVTKRALANLQSPVILVGHSQNAAHSRTPPTRQVGGMLFVPCDDARVVSEIEPRQFLPACFGERFEQIVVHRQRVRPDLLRRHFR